MKSMFFHRSACFALTTAVFAASGIFAQEATEASADADKAAEGGEQQAAEGSPAVVPMSKAFRFLPLMLCKEFRGGKLELQLPGSQDWVAVAEPGRYYPFGSTIRLVEAEGGEAFARFGIGPDAAITLSGNSSVATREIAIGAAERTVLLKGGKIGLELPRTLKDGLITVVSPDFTCKNIAGESRYECKECVEGREVTVRVVTGSMAIDGRHYCFEKVGVADQLRIFTSADALLTSLYGESGEAKAKLDCGVKSVLDPETGAYKDVAQSLEYALSPKCAVKIWRKVSEKTAGGSGRMAVAIQTFDAKGNDKNFRTFFEARANVNSGELIVSPVAKDEKKDDKKAKANEDAEEEAPAEESAGSDNAAPASDSAPAAEQQPAGDSM